MAAGSSRRAATRPSTSQDSSSVMRTTWRSGIPRTVTPDARLRRRARGSSRVSVTLVLGGARSGKSVLAEAMAEDRAGGAGVTYLATGWVPDGSDPGWAARVAAHRLRRPTGWRTVEVAADLAGALRAAEGVVLVDSLGTWVSGAPRFAVDTGPLLDALRERDGDTVLVSDEVGLGVHPETAVGVAFRDALGDLNRAVAAVADEAVLVVAGRPLR